MVFCCLLIFIKIPVVVCHYYIYFFIDYYGLVYYQVRLGSCLYEAQLFDYEFIKRVTVVLVGEEELAKSTSIFSTKFSALSDDQLTTLRLTP